MYSNRTQHESPTVASGSQALRKFPCSPSQPLKQSLRSNASNRFYPSSYICCDNIYSERFVNKLQCKQEHDSLDTLSNYGAVVPRVEGSTNSMKKQKNEETKIMEDLKKCFLVLKLRSKVEKLVKEIPLLPTADQETKTLWNKGKELVEGSNDAPVNSVKIFRTNSRFMGCCFGRPDEALWKKKAEEGRGISDDEGSSNERVVIKKEHVIDFSKIIKLFLDIWCFLVQLVCGVLKYKVRFAPRECECSSRGRRRWNKEHSRRRMRVSSSSSSFERRVELTESSEESLVRRKRVKINDKKLEKIVERYVGKALRKRDEKKNESENENEEEYDEKEKNRKKYYKKNEKINKKIIKALSDQTIPEKDAEKKRQKNDQNMKTPKKSVVADGSDDKKFMKLKFTKKIKSKEAEKKKENATISHAADMPLEQSTVLAQPYGEEKKEERKKEKEKKNEEKNEKNEASRNRWMKYSKGGSRDDSDQKYEKDDDKSFEDKSVFPRSELETSNHGGGSHLNKSEKEREEEEDEEDEDEEDDEEEEEKKEHEKKEEKTQEKDQFVVDEYKIQEKRDLEEKESSQGKRTPEFRKKVDNRLGANDSSGSVKKRSYKSNKNSRDAVLRKEEKEAIKIEKTFLLTSKSVNPSMEDEKAAPNVPKTGKKIQLKMKKTGGEYQAKVIKDKPK